MSRYRKVSAIVLSNLYVPGITQLLLPCIPAVIKKSKTADFRFLDNIWLKILKQSFI